MKDDLKARLETLSSNAADIHDAFVKMYSTPGDPEHVLDESDFDRRVLESYDRFQQMLDKVVVTVPELDEVLHSQVGQDYAKLRFIQMFHDCLQTGNSSLNDELGSGGMPTLPEETQRIGEAAANYVAASEFTLSMLLDDKGLQSSRAIQHGDGMISIKTMDYRKMLREAVDYAAERSGTRVLSMLKEPIPEHVTMESNPEVIYERFNVLHPTSESESVHELSFGDKLNEIRGTFEKHLVTEIRDRGMRLGDIGRQASAYANMRFLDRAYQALEKSEIKGIRQQEAPDMADGSPDKQLAAAVSETADAMRKMLMYNLGLQRGSQTAEASVGRLDDAIARACSKVGIQEIQI